MVVVSTRGEWAGVGACKEGWARDDVVMVDRCVEMVRSQLGVVLSNALCSLACPGPRSCVYSPNECSVLNLDVDMLSCVSSVCCARLVRWMTVSGLHR